MEQGRKAVTILLAEDDDDDYVLTRSALQEARVLNELRRVENGEELMDYLLQRGAYADRRAHPLPSLLLLDLNMPRMDGREALREIKQHPRLRLLPVVVLTTSRSDEDVARSYALGGNSYIKKPVSFPALVDALRVFSRYWFEIVDLPPETFGGEGGPDER